MNEELDRQAAQLLAEVEGMDYDIPSVETLEAVAHVAQERDAAVAESLAAVIETASEEAFPVPEQETSSAILSQVKESLEGIFPGNWDVQSTEEKHTILIRFPELTVTNSQNHREHIKELYVKFTFNSYWRLTSDPYGRRASFTYPQWESNYSFSHLPRSRGERWNRFCLGSSEMRVLCTEWQQATEEPFDIIQFELLMYQLDAYVRWESIGGGPYIRMASISIDGRPTYIRESVCKSALYLYIRKLKEKDMAFPLEYDASVSRFIVKESAIQETILEHKEFLQTECATDILFDNPFTNPDSWVKWDGVKHIYGSHDYNSIQRRIREFNRNAENNNSWQFTFKGQTVKPQIEEYEAPVEDNLMLVPHPYIVNHMAQVLQSKTNKYFIKTYGK